VNLNGLECQTGDRVVFKLGPGDSIEILRKAGAEPLQEGEFIGEVIELFENGKKCRFVTSRDLERSGHKRMSFFRYNGQPAIPPTSLKGMIRSVVEAASNSCFSQFEEGRLGKRGIPDDYSKLNRRPGIIRKLATKDGEDGEIEEMEAYKVAHTLPTDKSDFEFKNNPNLNGTKVYFLHEGWTVTELRKVPATEKYKECYLKTSDKGLPRGTGKQSERVFAVKSGPKNHSLPYEIQKNYNLANQNNKHPITQTLEVGDTVWFVVKKDDKVEEVGFTQIYRRAFKYSLESRLKKIDPDLLPCSDREKLCPACRMFGMLAGDEQSYAGNIAFSIALANGTSFGFTTDLVPLQILASPKPTYAPFYVTSESNGYLDTYNDEDSFLRGRKFYFHKLGTTPKTVECEDKEKKTNQNSSVELLTKGTFTFSIDFENLSDYELGLLLYALQLEDGLMHRLGMGKPLGLGSVKITIDPKNSFIINRQKRYEVLWSKNEDEMLGKEKLEVEELVRKFKRHQCSTGENASLEDVEKAFGELDYIKDLREILSFNERLAQVKYPRRKDRNDEPKGYAWFQWNRSKRQAVPTLEQTKNGETLTGWE
jgi:CRISPR-associated protein (TIGR03986 family)